MTDWVDTWARLVAQRVSRRQLLGGMGAIAAGGALGALTPAAASGSVRHTCCNNVCTDTMTDPNKCGCCGKACECGPGFTAVCTNGTCSCQCLPPNSACPGPAGTVCVNTSYDVNNCGTCGNVCANHCTPAAGFSTTCDAGWCANIEPIVQSC